MFDLKGKNILVTGASSGLGQHIAAFYAQQGANIIICARREERLKQLRSRQLFGHLSHMGRPYEPICGGHNHRRAGAIRQ